MSSLRVSSIPATTIVSLPSNADSQFCHWLRRCPISPVIVTKPSTMVESEHSIGSVAPLSSPHDSDGTTCHILPCNIEFQGMAATHTFFRPVDFSHSNGDDYIASSFRGRGLLAKKPLSECTPSNPSSSQCTTPKPLLLSLNHNKIQIKSAIDRLIEWQHESNPATLDFESSTKPSRIRVATEWCQVAKALHDPIPVEDCIS